MRGTVHGKLGMYNPDHVDSGSMVSQQCSFGQVDRTPDMVCHGECQHNVGKEVRDYLDNELVRILIRPKYGILGIVVLVHHCIRHAYHSSTRHGSTNEYCQVDNLLRTCTEVDCRHSFLDTLYDQYPNKSENIIFIISVITF